MADECNELFVMKAQPRTPEGINLTEDIWKIEEKLGLLYSSVRKAYVSYSEPGESGIELRINGTLFLKFPNKKLCEEKFEEMTNRISKKKVLQGVVYQPLELESYKLSKRIQGKIDEVVPQGLLAFINEEKKYDPRQVTFEFVDRDEERNFIKIKFDRSTSADKLLLDVAVESNEVKRAKASMKKIEGIIKRAKS